MNFTFQPFFRYYAFFIFCAPLSIFSGRIVAQDLGNIDKKNPVKVTGGFNATQTFYHAAGIENRRDPYYWLLNGNINFNLFGVLDIPLSATVSQQNRSYTQPFNQYGISPRYKWLTGHFGYRTMQFSQYTLGGNIFLGGGFEAAPENSWIKGSVMYGRFTKAVYLLDTNGIVTGEPAFDRRGWGSKITIGRQNNHQVDLIAFHARDNYSSVPVAISDSFGLKPAENLVLGFVTRQSVTERINLDFEYALSAYTQDTRMGREETESYKLFNNLGDVFIANMSTQFNKAILANLTYNANLYQFRVSFRRIDPEYKTMGSVFLNNDIQDITGNLGWKMFKNKMNISTGAGIQKNNLDNALASRMNRFIGNVNWSFVVSKKLNLNASYSNFMANTKINNTRVLANQLGLNQNVDSLAYNQVTNSASGGINYNTGNDKMKHVLFSNGNYQRANDNQKNGSVFYNITTGYQQSITPMGFNVAVSCTYNNSHIKENDVKSVGPNLSASKLLFQKKLRSTLGITYLQTYSNGSLTGNNSLFRLSNSYKKGKHHTVTMDLTYLLRTVNVGTGKSFKEFRGSLVYGFTF